MKLGELAALLSDHLSEHPDHAGREVLIHAEEEHYGKVIPISNQGRAYYEFDSFDQDRVEFLIKKVPGVMGGRLTGFVSDLNGMSS